MRPVAVYSALRVGLFLACLLLLRVLGVGGLLSLVLALVLAMLLSFLILRRQRDAVTRALMDRKKARRPPGAADPAPPLSARARGRGRRGRGRRRRRRARPEAPGGGPR